METTKDSLDDILWDKYDDIQKGFNGNLTEFQISIKYFKDVLIEIERHILTLNKLNIDSQIKKFTKLNDIFHLFNLLINFNLENHKKFINNTITNLEKFITEFKKVIPIYSEFKQFNDTYISKKKKLNSLKKKFYDSASILENKILDQVKKKNQNANIDNVEIPEKNEKDVIENLKKYQLSIFETNEKREDLNSKQKNLIKLYIELENIYLNVYFDILDDFLSLENNKAISFLNNSKFKKFQNNLQNKNLDEYSKKYFSSIKPIEKSNVKKKIKFEGYQSKFNLDNCTNEENYKQIVEVTNIINEKYLDLFDKKLVKLEKMKIKMKELVLKFFELDEKNISFDEKEKEEYYKALTIYNTHKSFLMEVNNIRTAANVNRNKNLIDLLGLSFKLIIAQARNKKDYWSAKICLILSQTFYYLENDKKIYPYEFIKNDNSWLKEKKFWIGFSSYMINEELKKLYTPFPELKFEDIQQNKDFSGNLKTKISNVIFSQLYTLLTNALDFTHNKLLIFEIIDKFKKKYIYLSEKNVELLYQIISVNKDDIIKIKEEYEYIKNNENNNTITLKGEKENETENNDIYRDDIDKINIIIEDKNENENNEQNKVTNDNEDNEEIK